MEEATIAKGETMKGVATEASGEAEASEVEGEEEEEASETALIIVNQALMTNNK